MKTLSDYFGVNYEYADIEDIHTKIKALKIAESLTGREVDTLLAAFDKGLLESGETPSKFGRAELLGKKVLCQTCHKGNDYTFSVTYPLGYHVVMAYKMLASLSGGSDE